MIEAHRRCACCQRSSNHRRLADDSAKHFFRTKDSKADHRRTQKKYMACAYVHAAFYLWYGTPETDGRWLHWDHPTLPHWTEAMNQRFPPGVPFVPPDEPHAPFYPERGLYSSSDPVALRGQMAELAAAGVDSVMLSWWGQTALGVRRDSQGVDTDPLVPMVLDAAAESGTA